LFSYSLLFAPLIYRIQAVRLLVTAINYTPFSG